MARSIKTAAQYCLLSMAVMISFRTLSVAEAHPCPAPKTRLHSGEGIVGFEMVGDLFVHLVFKDFRKVGQDAFFLGNHKGYQMVQRSATLEGPVEYNAVSH